MSLRPYFSWASCAAPLAGGLVGLVPAGRVELIARVLIGIAIGSAAGMICAALAIWRHEGPFMFFLLGLSVQLGITRIHM